MALQCIELERFSANNYYDGGSVEEIDSLNTSFSIPTTVSRLKNTENLKKKTNSRHSTAKFATRKPLTASDCRGTVDYLPNGCRSIIDLPPALVSEILHLLDPKDLGVVSCVSILLQKLASDHHSWKEFYCERWGLPLPTAASPGSNLPGEKSWKDLFVEREGRSKSFMGRFTIDTLRGHTEAVRAVSFLQSAKLIFTGGYDSIIRIWDAVEGLALTASPHLGCTIRAIAVDSYLLVVGGTDAFIQCWKVIEGNPHLFDIANSTANPKFEFRLWGHHGPITCLGLDSARIYSGSWDMTVRVWDRLNFKCIRTLNHGDWVWDLVPRGSTIASSAGRDVYIWDSANGKLIDAIHNAHIGNTCALARSYLGDLLFTGGENGDIHMFKLANGNDEDDEIKPCATWKPHENSVNSLSFEFPWLVSCSSDGRLALIDVRKLLKSSHSSVGKYSRINPSSSVNVEPPQRMLHGSGNGWFSVVIGADRIICGGDEGTLRLWDFSQALEIEERVRALRTTRLEHRMRRRRIQIEMSCKSGLSDQSSGASKKGQKNGNRNASWGAKRETRNQEA
ncbi:F-box/WD-40 repeat-containing protein At5g21040 [Phalaenopsis equestris]|uniref:F-box/WD-40 repeat-containing protein At5g21040 n=1 Tax=Phalaenopsis equestris TaxID=78828 RepID=UPI0009E27837|nr:F-box/WD-40 repeat-containing protein At5g21040 [Phalaenopsis equestris]XP_020600085.1 F-box/WD-40 repeat-containing protein At5g21040 [Phalaenopsis equestris]XP_020600086.1 F-box/WD-40 repeat-containing protein At5g21040 [Phalaenopsis equestris]